MTTTTTPTALARQAADVAQSLSLKTLGEVFARSGYFDDARQASQAIVKILYGRELGVPPVTAMMGIYIINGKPSASAGLLASRIKSSGHYAYKIKRLDNTGCELEIFEDGQLVGPSSFVEADAKAAGAFEGRNKHTWKSFPRNMYFARAISNACRWYCADLFGGSPVYTPEEMGAQVDDEGGVIVEAQGRYVPTREQDLAEPSNTEPPTAEEKAAPRDTETGEVLDDTPGEIAPAPAPTTKRTYDEIFEPEPAATDDRPGRLQSLLAMAKRRGLQGAPPPAVGAPGPSSLDEAIAYWDARITNHDLDLEAAKSQEKALA